ncbi:hypothetical protein [Halobacillus naozhouensis]|uniref:ABC-2 type transport system permease protein n=1 Tax=Halobacillus naozhouensis TaxID=554880 RepID=A0ABY8IZN4_9BACI|nr:hypothetical protein [Halobacillus naozhouensis]WFT74764.1 hypothetical protein P9989_20885 [Halobacillus naozhouensis]
MESSTWTVYRWVRGERARKKRNLYKQAFSLNFDWTLALYLTIYTGIMLVAIYEWLQGFLPLVETWQSSFGYWLWLLPFAVLLRACSQSFFHPGVLFTSSELKMSLLTHSKHGLFWFIVVERGLVHGIVSFTTGSLIGIITPFSLLFLLKVAAIYNLFFLLTMMVHWKMYSISRWKKLFIIVLLFIIVGSLRFLIIVAGWSGFIVGVMLCIVLIGVNFYILPNVLRHVDWAKVISVNDAKVWNIKLIGKMTNIEIKPPKRYGILQTYLRSRRAKQRFTNIYSLYHRLWRNHLQSQFKYIGITIVACIVILTILPIQVEWMLWITTPIALFIYIEVAVSLFEEQFHQQPILRILPIEEKGWKTTYFKWAVSGVSLLAITFFITTWLLSGLGISLFIQVIGFMFLAVYELLQQIRERMYKVQRLNYQKNDFLQLAGYVFLGLGIYFAPIMLAVLLLPWIGKYIKASD